MNLPARPACQLVPQAMMLILREARGTRLRVISISSRKTCRCLLRDAAERGVANGARLLVDFLEHEVLEAALFRHDRVPGDVLHLARHRVAVEVGELHAVGREDGHVAIGQEEDVARVVEDRGDVGGDEVFVVTEADDAGGPLRAATILSGSSAEITASAKTPAVRLTVLRTASSSEGRCPLDRADKYFSTR